MLTQLETAEQYEDAILSAAEKHGVQPAIILGVGSRESAWGLTLRPRSCAGTGDFTKRKPRKTRKARLPPNGLGFGRGLMQIDYDWHEFAKTGQWRDAGANIDYGCQVLRQAIDYIAKKTELQGEDLIFAGISGYNCGAYNAYKGIKHQQCSDHYTTGGDYASDVLNRAGWFQLHNWY
ncbi:MAG: hypothetical protein VSS52_009560 [Thiotrichaceae bacterium]|nr:hypothetical protein [Thiotrichaceae bacterium]